MPAETRRIVFSNAELLLALIAQSKSNPDSKLNSGNIISCTVKDQQDGIVHMQIQGDDGQPTTVAVPHASVGAALLRFCREVKIPIPRRGKKSLQVVGEDIGLFIETNAD